MPAFLKLGDIKGEATDQDHKDWIRINTMSSGITRSVPEGAKDQQRSRGDTTLADISINRQLDKSSTKLAEACASGKYFPEAQIDLCVTVKGKQQPYLTYKLKNVIVSNYSFSGTASGEPQPMEQVSLAFTAVEWVYVVVDPDTGDNKGNVPAKYEPASGKVG